MRVKTMSPGGAARFRHQSLSQNRGEAMGLTTPVAIGLFFASSESFAVKTLATVKTGAVSLTALLTALH